MYVWWTIQYLGHMQRKETESVSTRHCFSLYKDKHKDATWVS